MKGKFSLALIAALLIFGIPGLGQSQHSITVTWGASPTTGVSYNVYRANAPAGPFTKVNSADVAALTYTDASGTGGVNYYYEITAICDSTTTCPSGVSGESAPTPVSAAVTFLGDPAAPAAAPTVKAN